MWPRSMVRRPAPHSGRYKGALIANLWLVLEWPYQHSSARCWIGPSSTRERAKRAELEATTCAASCNGPQTTTLPCSPRRVRTSSCAAAGWKSVVSPPRQSDHAPVGGSRPTGGGPAGRDRIASSAPDLSMGGDVVFHCYRHAIGTFIDGRAGGGRGVTRAVLGHTGQKSPTHHYVGLRRGQGHQPGHLRSPHPGRRPRPRGRRAG
jgi:hypothetical protein